MIAARTPRGRLRTKINEFLDRLDDEQITTFQLWIYYPLIITAGLYLTLFADDPTLALRETLGPVVYTGWLAVLNIMCPLATIVGRWMYAKAALVAPGEPHEGYGGAWLQLVGDAGVWSAILIYVACLLNTTYWGEALYPTFYLLMGIPGGMLFTIRSARRLMQVRRRKRKL